MFDSSVKALKKLDAALTTLTAYGGSKITQFGVRIIKCLWNKPEVEISLSHCRCYRPNTAGIEDSKTHGYLCEAFHGVH